MLIVQIEILNTHTVFQKADTSWILLPSNIEYIQIPSILMEILK